MATEINILQISNLTLLDVAEKIRKDLLDKLYAFMIGNKIIEISQNYKYLGEVITTDLNLAAHLKAKE